MRMLNTMSTRQKVLTYRTIVVFGMLIVGLSLVLFASLNSGRLVYAAEDLKAAADVDRSGEIDIRDLTLVGKHFNKTIGPNQGIPNPDVDRDGTVNIRDLTLVAKYFGQTVEQPPVVPFDGPIDVTDATFNNVVLNSALPVVVEFEADWCPFCRRMIPVVDEVAQEYHNTFSVVRLDIDANRQIPAKYGVRGIPAYRVFRNGKVVGVFVGAMPKANFVKSVLDSLR